MADGVVRPEERCSGSRPEERCSGSRPADRDVSEEIGYRREIGPPTGGKISKFEKMNVILRIRIYRYTFLSR